MVPYLVCEFAKSTLSNLIKERFGDDFPDIFDKSQIAYSYAYLKALRAKTVLLEFEYVDKDYLEDYTRYYVRRFNSDGHKCARLHFFSEKVEHCELDKIIAGQLPQLRIKRLQENYLGFMVLKPLPRTFIGKTCLKVYKRINANGSNRVCLTREYKVNLFGIELVVNSIPMQEQDKVVSACATTAIWSALHALRWRHPRDLPACSEITINAINHIAGSSNSFPKQELSNKQILRALDVEGLRHHSIPAAALNVEAFISAIRTAIDSGLPLLLGVDVYSVKENGVDAEKVGGHAVTVLGYKYFSDDESQRALYVHDDRIGPFLRATFIDLKKYKLPDGVKSSWGLVFQRRGESGRWKKPHEVLIPDSLIFPMHRKVRISPVNISNTCDLIVDEFEGWVREQPADGPKNFGGKLTFNVKLEEISEIKKRIHLVDLKKTQKAGKFFSEKVSDDELKILVDEKAKFLTKSFARFQWVAYFKFSGIPAFQILFDATDIPQGNAVSAIFREDYLASELVLGVFHEYANLDLRPADGHSFFTPFLRYLRRPTASLDDHLDATYGPLRAPRYLKETEILALKQQRQSTIKTYYESVDNSLAQEFPRFPKRGKDGPFLIWAIAYDGALLIGDEAEGMGHPALTGFKPARIAGELWRDDAGWKINAKSGRYSGDYPDPNALLASALKKFNSVFRSTRDKIEMIPYK